MKTRSLLMTGVFCLATIACPNVSGGIASLEFGIHPVQARDYYTRKRINGQWVTGVFPKKGTNLEAEMTAKEAAQQDAPAEPSPPPRPTLLGLNIPGIDLTYRPSAGEQMKEIEAAHKAAEQEKDRKVTATIQTAAYTGATKTAAAPASRLIEGTPGVQDKPESELKLGRKRQTSTAKDLELKKDPEPEKDPERKWKPVAPAAVEARSRSDTEFAAAVAQPVPPAEPMVPVAVQSYASNPERNDLLSALRRKAQAMAEEEASTVTGTAGGGVGSHMRTALPSHAVPAQPPGAVKPIRTVTFDYENGIRTTVFQDNSIEEEVIPTPMP